MSTDTIPVNIPRSAVEALQKGSSVDAATDAIRAVREAVLNVDIPSPSVAPGTTWVDPDGDLWVTGPNGKVGLLIIDAPSDYGDGEQAVVFGHDSSGFTPERLGDGWRKVYDPTEAVTNEPPAVIDTDGDRWERQGDGTYYLSGMDPRTYEELVAEFGPLEVAS